MSPVFVIQSNQAAAQCQVPLHVGVTSAPHVVPTFSRLGRQETNACYIAVGAVMRAEVGEGWGGADLHKVVRSPSEEVTERAMQKKKVTGRGAFQPEDQRVKRSCGQ